MFKIFPHKMLSNGCRALSNSLGALRIRSEGGGLALTERTVVINWGRSRFSRAVGGALVLNRPEAVDRAADKLQTFRILSDLEIDNPTNYPYKPARMVDHVNPRGTGGQGLVVRPREDPVTEGTVASVPYIPKGQEYRVHVFQGEVIDLQRKAAREGMEQNWEVRNLANGFVFVRDDMKWDADVTEEMVMSSAVGAIDALDLDFGAVDLVVSKRNGRAYVLEVNTAPGLEGSTVEAYASAFLRHHELVVGPYRRNR